MTIENVSDTARWVAVYRAMESERPDAIFRDPYARKLAGAHGEKIVATMKGGQSAAWAMIVRTAVFDEVILARIAAGADVVVNLAAGLDARPWRMKLPPTLRWIDVDLPGILNYKTEMMRDVAPHCLYEAVTIDLTDAAARAGLFARIGAESKNVFVISEGLLVYLPAMAVTGLAESLSVEPAFKYWLIDLASPRLLKMMNRMWGKSVAAARAPFLFGPESGTAYFEPSGWREKEWHSMRDDSKRLNRQMRLAWLWGALSVFAGAKNKEMWRRFSGAALLERTR
jgi:methyltransferase (TIGR00027 family)